MSCDLKIYLIFESVISYHCCYSWYSINFTFIYFLTDPKSESPSSSTYIPRDENFGHLKSSDFLTYGIKSIAQTVLPTFQSAFGLNAEFDRFDDVRGLFEGGIHLPTDALSKISPLPVLKEIFRTDGEQVLKFPPPHVIKGIVYIVISYFFLQVKSPPSANTWHQLYLVFNICFPCYSEQFVSLNGWLMKNLEERCLLVLIHA